MSAPRPETIVTYHGVDGACAAAMALLRFPQATLAISSARSIGRTFAELAVAVVRLCCLRRKQVAAAGESLPPIRGALRRHSPETTTCRFRTFAVQRWDGGPKSIPAGRRGNLADSTTEVRLPWPDARRSSSRRPADAFTNATGTVTDLGIFLFGRGRASLEAYRPIRMNIQKGECLWCQKPLNRGCKSITLPAGHGSRC